VPEFLRGTPALGEWWNMETKAKNIEHRMETKAKNIEHRAKKATYSAFKKDTCSIKKPEGLLASVQFAVHG
jgi:hypothetical protein